MLANLTAADRAAIVDTAGRLGIDPADLTAVMAYETIGSMSPDQRGGAGGGYRGLIQFGKEERKQYGYQLGMSFAEQVTGPVFNYLSDRGVKPGMGLLDLYSTVNAGSPGHYGRKDASGKSVRQHVAAIKASYLPQAQAIVGGAAAPVAAAGAVPGGPRTLRKGMSGPDVAELQQQLADAGIYKGKVDGDYGKLTERAVRNFEIAQSLPAERRGRAAAGPQVTGRLAGNASTRDILSARDLVPGGPGYVSPEGSTDIAFGRQPAMPWDVPGGPMGAPPPTGIGQAPGGQGSDLESAMSAAPYDYQQQGLPSAGLPPPSTFPARPERQFSNAAPGGPVAVPTSSIGPDGTYNNDAVLAATRGAPPPVSPDPNQFGPDMAFLSRLAQPMDESLPAKVPGGPSPLSSRDTISLEHRANAIVPEIGNVSDAQDPSRQARYAANRAAAAANPPPTFFAGPGAGELAPPGGPVVAAANNNFGIDLGNAASAAWDGISGIPGAIFGPGGPVMNASRAVNGWLGLGGEPAAAMPGRDSHYVQPAVVPGNQGPELIPGYGGQQRQGYTPPTGGQRYAGEVGGIDPRTMLTSFDQLFDGPNVGPQDHISVNARPGQEMADGPSFAGMGYAGIQPDNQRNDYGALPPRFNEPGYAPSPSGWKPGAYASASPNFVSDAVVPAGGEPLTPGGPGYRTIDMSKLGNGAFDMKAAPAYAPPRPVSAAPKSTGGISKLISDGLKAIGIGGGAPGGPGAGLSAPGYSPNFAMTNPGVRSAITGSFGSGYGSSFTPGAGYFGAGSPAYTAPNFSPGSGGSTFAYHADGRGGGTFVTSDGRVMSY